MQYISKYQSPLGEIVMAADDAGLTGLWFRGQKFFALHLDEEHTEKELPIFIRARAWLDVYFSGTEPDDKLPLHLIGTRFQNEVWKLLSEIPYGQTTTYGDISKHLAKQRGVAHMSAQAIGNAVGHNPISIIVPCHRVIGANGNLTGYAGGIARKIALLKLECGDQDAFFVPTHHATS